MKRRFLLTMLIVGLTLASWLSAITADAHPMVDPPALDYTASFGRQIGEPGYDAQADLTCDRLVDLLDFNVLRASPNTPAHNSNC
jgi:hypothetical protein